MAFDGVTIAAYTALGSSTIAACRWAFFDRKTAANAAHLATQAATQATEEILENRLAQYRKENRDLTDGLDECKRACRRCEERIEAAEDNATRWRHEADHWKAVATGGSY